MNYIPPGTRDYTPCNLCGRPVNMQKFMSLVQQAYAQNPALQQQTQNSLMSVPPCDVCQERMAAMMTCQQMSQQ